MEIVSRHHQFFFFLFQGWYLEALRMALPLTYHYRHSYNTAANKIRLPEPLAIELLTFISRRIGKHQNLHEVCTQADFEKFLLQYLKFL
jgi:hypothetical protein